MTISARTPARAAGHTRRAVLSLLAALAACALAATLAAPAGAGVTDVAGPQVGLQPRTMELIGPEEGFGHEPPKGSFSNLNGNPVVDGANVYIVYWDQGAIYHPEWIRKVDEFAQGVAQGSGHNGTIFDALSQYHDRSNHAAAYDFHFQGAYDDTTPYPAAGCTDPAPLEVGLDTCLTDAQLREHLSSWIASQGKPKGMHAIYFVVTPPGVTFCLTAASTHCSDYTLSAKEIEKGLRESATYKNSFCSYHGAINPSKAPAGDANTILYAAIPWSAGYLGEGGIWDIIPSEAMQGVAIDCQAGGWSVQGGGEHPEKEPKLQEPNQEGLGEEGDFTPGLADVIVNQIAEEQANIVTDPLLTSWHNTFTGSEATDECRNIFASTSSPSKIEGAEEPVPHTEAGTLSNETIGESHYYINNVLDMGDLHYPRCVGGLGLIPRFTSPARANAGETVSFDGLESTISEFKSEKYGESGPPALTYATFSWNFGDGSPAVSGFAPGSPACQSNWLSPCAGSANHAYTYGGTYTVTLTVTDAGGNVDSVSHEVTIDGPPPPPAPPAPGGGPTAPGATPGGQPGSSGGSSGTGSGGKGGGVLPAPAARAAVASHSLRNALSKGLPVTYSVNEQVTGHFEVLIARSLARRLHISGTPATGLPAGTPPQLVIARAVLVTTKAGGSTVHIKFPKSVAAHLKHARSAPLMVRLVVRNGSAAVATVLSAVTLTG